jgi:hypothetical protein
LSGIAALPGKPIVSINLFGLGRRNKTAGREPLSGGYRALFAVFGGIRSRRNLGRAIWAILRRHDREPTGESMKKAHRKGQLRKKRRKLELRRQQVAARKAPKA